MLYLLNHVCTDAPVLSGFGLFLLKPEVLRENSHKRAIAFYAGAAIFGNPMSARYLASENQVTHSKT
jgi:hypothetical protein